MKNLKSLLVIFIITLFCYPQLNNAQVEATDFVLGKTIVINSKILGEDRNIFIYTPFGYENSEQKYPVLYVLDGGRNFIYSAAVVNFLARNQRMARTIVVGIPNTDRARDFTPTREERFPTAGGADKFLKFMEDELFVHIDDNYRTQPFRTLFGHSLCGMFAIYTLFTQPDMFDAYIAVSPYLMYDNEYVINKVESVLSETSNFKKDLYITIGDEPTYTNSLNRISDLLSNNAENLNWKLSKREGENHGSVPLLSVYDGLEFIYSDWPLNNDVALKGIDAIKEHYSNLIEKYGYDIKIPEFTLNVIGYQLLQEEEIEKAIEVFEHNVNLYPNSANVYDSLGDALERSGELTSAKNNYEIAVKNGEKLEDPNLNIYKQNFDRVQKAIN